MKKLLLALVSVILTSCTAESVAQEELVKTGPPIHVNKMNTFTVIWASNQERPYVEFTKHVFKDCKIQSTTLEVYRDHQFEITLEDNQMFDLQIKKEASVKDPELYLSIYKDGELQYEQEVNTGGFMMSNFVDRDGNISK